MVNERKSGPGAALSELPLMSRIHLDPAIHAQPTTKPLAGNGLFGGTRALDLLGGLVEFQEGLSQPQAQAWERAVFCEVFGHPEPGTRIQAFLEGARPGA